MPSNPEHAGATWTWKVVDPITALEGSDTASPSRAPRAMSAARSVDGPSGHQSSALDWPASHAPPPITAPPASAGQAVAADPLTLPSGTAATNASTTDADASSAQPSSHATGEPRGGPADAKTRALSHHSELTARRCPPRRSSDQPSNRRPPRNCWSRSLPALRIECRADCARHGEDRQPAQGPREPPAVDPLTERLGVERDAEGEVLEGKQTEGGPQREGRSSGNADGQDRCCR